MFRFSSSRTCLLCTKISSQLTAIKQKQKNILCHLKTSKACPLQDNISVRCLGVSSYRSFSVGCTSRDNEKNDIIDFSQDPEVKKWMREMQGDFSKEKAMNDDLEYGENQEKHEDNEYGEDLKNQEGMIKPDNATMHSNSASQETKDHPEYMPSVKCKFNM